MLNASYPYYHVADHDAIIFLCFWLLVSILITLIMKSSIVLYRFHIPQSRVHKIRCGCMGNAKNYSIFENETAYIVTVSKYDFLPKF